MPNTTVYLGYAIYSFEDLRNDPKPLFQLFSLLNRQFGGQFLNVIRASRVTAAEAESNQFTDIDRRELYSYLDEGVISKLQTHDGQTVSESSILLRIAINSFSDDDDSPSFVFIAFPKEEHGISSSDSVAARGLETAVKIFEILNGAYGYANAGMLTNDGDIPLDGQASFALGLVDFGQLAAAVSIRYEIPGIFWANLLGNYQVESIGGLAKVLTSVDCYREEQIGVGGVLLVLCPDPFAAPGELDVSVLESMVKLLEDSTEAFRDRLFETSLHTATRAEKPQYQYRQVGLEVLKWHVQKFDEDYLQVGKVPRNHVWRPYRFCTQDVVLGLTVVRHSPDRNCLEVDVCLTSDIPEYEDGSGARVMASFLLSEAYKCGGSMEIRFTENVENGRVPLALIELAAQHQVRLSYIDEGKINPSESRRLYTAVTDFSSSLQSRIEELTNQGRLSQEKACFVVQRGIWTKAELEHLVFGSSRADAILGGEALPEQRQLFLNDLGHARAAVMGGFLDRKMARRQRGDEAEAVDLEDDVRPLRIDFDDHCYAKVYQSTEDLPIPWVVNGGIDSVIVPANSQALILIRARDAIDLKHQLADDLALARQMKELTVLQDPKSQIGVLVPRDFEDLLKTDIERLEAEAQRLGIHILVCPETSTALNTDAMRRMATSRITRE